jgi:dynamin 1-like protein
MGPLLLHLLNKFSTAFADALDGRSPDVSSTELYGGARISYVFHELFCVNLDELDPFEFLSDHDIRTTIRNATGPRPSLFIPEISFELLVKRQIERLQPPSLQCVDMVSVLLSFAFPACFRVQLFIHSFRCEF